MRKSNEQSIGEALERFLKEFNLDKKMKRSSVINNWEKYAGKVISNHTKNIFFVENNLVVELDSAGVRHELSFKKDELKKIINTELKEEIVSDIILK